MEFTESVRRNVTTGAYAQFTGRASRSEYWWFVLAATLAGVAAGFVDGMAGTYFFTGLALLGAIVPSLAIQVRRLHDTNKSGWMLLLSLVPFVGAILIFVWCITPGDKAPNKYGPPSR